MHDRLARSRLVAALPVGEPGQIFRCTISPTMGAGKQSNWEFTDEIVNEPVARWGSPIVSANCRICRQIDRTGRGGLSEASASIAALSFGEITLRAPRSTRVLRISAIKPNLRYLAHPPLRSPERDLPVSCYCLQGLILLEMWLNQPKP